MTYTDLNPDEFNAYYANYIKLSGEDNILSGLLNTNTVSFFNLNLPYIFITKFPKT